MNIQNAKVPQQKEEVKKPEELSEEDLKIKEAIEYLVEKIVMSNESEADKIRYTNQLLTEINTVRGTRTALPKQLKFLKSGYQSIVDFYNSLPKGSFSRAVADLLSVASITLAENYDRDSLKYFREGSNILNLDTLGDEFVLNLAGDISSDFENRFEGDKTCLNDLYVLCDLILPFMFKYGHEVNAVDLLLETEYLDALHKFIDSQNYTRIFNYLISSLEYSADNVVFNSILETLYRIATDHKDYTNALRVSIRNNDHEKIKQTVLSCKDKVVRWQLAFMLGRHRLFILNEAEKHINLTGDQNFVKIASNELLSTYYIELQKDLDVNVAKKPSDIYKNMLENKDQKIDSAQLNLADSFVNGFVNLGSLAETLLDNRNGGDKAWITRVKDAGVMSTVASLGLIYLWNFDECSSVLAEYFDLKDGYAKAGACIALGLSTSGIWNESDPAKAMLEDAIQSEEFSVKLGASIGLGLAYAASSRSDLRETLEPIINDENLAIDVSGCAALSLSLIFVADCDADVSNTILTSLMAFSRETLNKPFAKFLSVALGLNFLGQQSKSEAVLQAVQSIEHPIGKFSELVIEICAYIGSGNVLKIQEYMQRASNSTEDASEIEMQCLALVGIALISISETVGTNIIIRLIHQILHYCDIALKRVVPIMLTIIGVANTNIQITDLLYKLAHDEDQEIGLRSLLGLGIVGAGSNNSRIANLLRSLAGYYESENDYIYIIKIALGILHAGKGLVGISPFYSDGFLFSKTGYASLVILAFSMMNMQEFLIKNNHYLFYYLTLSIYPKMLFFLDEDLKEIKVNVRVGQAIDTVGQVGKPRKITGFQTHTSPVLINNGERQDN
jgi:26S proteasome regulatory subunit N1